MSVPLVWLCVVTSTGANDLSLRTSAEMTAINDGAIQVDGSGDEVGWASAPWSDGFVQQIPNEDSPPTEPTRFKVAHDGGAIYFLIEALDSQPEKIVGQLTRRDAESASDWVHVWIDPFDAGHTSFRFSVNAAGVKLDARLDEGLEDDFDWNAIWDAAVGTSSTGWSVELRIPLSELRYTEGHPNWRFEVGRELLRRNEKSFFSPVPSGAGRFMEYFGRLGGTETIPSVIDASMVPYVSESITQRDGELEADIAAGGDARLGLGSALVLELTINPDFAQVEADPSTLNLTATETFFQEKRPFFVSGKDVLAFGIGYGNGDLGLNTLFYSRRIGTDRVLGAAKLIGKSTSGWSVGALDAVVGGTDAEPLGNAAVVRATQELDAGNTRFGFITTHLYRDLEGSEIEQRLERAAAFGVDLDQRAGDFRLTMRLYGSNVGGSQEAVARIQEGLGHNFSRPDARHLRFDPSREALTGWGTTIIAEKNDGKYFRGALGTQILSPELEINPLGYLPFSDRQLAFLWVQFRQDDPGAIYQNYQINLNLFARRTFGEELVGSGGDMNGSLVTPFWWEIFTGFGHDQSFLDTSILRGGPALKIEPAWFGWIGFESDLRKSIAALFEIGGTTGNRDSTNRWYIFLRATLKPTSWLDFQLQPEFSHSDYGSFYYDTIDGAPLIAHLERDTFIVSLRANWTINTDVSVQLYASPYFTSGNYSRYRDVVSPRANGVGVRYAERALPDDRFTFDQVRANLVFRWEYALGSTFYAVWSHGQTLEENTGQRTPFDDFGALFSAPSDDVVLVKLAHRLEW
jgi:hypothetical protein